MKLRAWIAATAISSMFLNPQQVNAQIPNHTEKFYVNDYADVLSDEEEDELTSEGELLYKLTTAQVVLLTVDSTGDEEIADYAVDTFRSWGIGSKESDNGILIVLAAEDRNVWVTVGYGLEGDLPDAKVGRLIDTYAVPYYKEDDFAEGSKQLYYALDNEVRDIYDQNPAEIQTVGIEAETTGRSGISMALGIALMVFYWYVCISGILFLMGVLQMTLTYLSLRYSSSERQREKARKFYKKEMVKDHLKVLFRGCFFDMYMDPIKEIFSGSDDDYHGGSGFGGGSFHGGSSSGGSFGGGGSTGGGGAGRGF